MRVITHIKRLLAKPKTQPVNWPRERKSVHAYRRDNPHNSAIAKAIFAVPGVNDLIVIVEYVDKMTVEIMVSGGAPTEVATAILNAKPMGLWTVGTEQVMIGFFGVQHEISFTHIKWLGDFAA